MKLNKTKAIVLTTAMALGVIGGAYAFYQGTANTVSNTFNIVAGESGAVVGVINEPGWDATKAVNLEPGEKVVKNPSLKSQADYESWAFIEVHIPTVTATLNDQEGVYDAVTLNGVDENFTLIKDGKSATAGTDSVYIYGYIPALAAGAETPALFSGFTVQDFTKCGAIADDIEVSGHMVQTTNITDINAAAATLGLNK